MRAVFLHLHYPNNNDSRIYQDLQNDDINISIVQRNNINSINKNIHFVKDEFNQELKWWQNSETLNKYIGGLNPDLIYIFSLNLPLHFRWLKHHISSKTILIGQHCGEDIWIQRNLWLQQSALRVVDGFIFPTKKNADPWLKCAAILESQQIFEIENFQTNIIEIYNSLLKNKLNSE